MLKEGILLIKNGLRIVAIHLTVNLVLIIPYVSIWMWMENIQPIAFLTLLVLIWSLIPVILYYILTKRFVYFKNKKRAVILSLSDLAISIIWTFVFEDLFLIVPFLPLLEFLENVFGIPEMPLMIVLSFLAPGAILVSGVASKDKI